VINESDLFIVPSQSAKLHMVPAEAGKNFKLSRQGSQVKRGAAMQSGPRKQVKSWM
jgi:hypothetical protein